jgi:diaminopimelate decarboxylase
MTLLDIGGGFTGHFDSHGHVMFGDVARTINAALSAYFPADAGVRVIAEPGRYFAETSASLLVPVYGKRDRCVWSVGGWVAWAALLGVYVCLLLSARVSAALAVPAVLFFTELQLLLHTVRCC